MSTRRRGTSLAPEIGFLQINQRGAIIAAMTGPRCRKNAGTVFTLTSNYYDQANQLKEIRAAGDLQLENFSCSQDVLRRVDQNICAEPLISGLRACASRRLQVPCPGLRPGRSDQIAVACRLQSASLSERHCTADRGARSTKRTVTCTPGQMA